MTCTSQSAYIGTPGYPSDIALSDTCTWKIQGTFGSYVRMHILNLDIQDEDGSCVKSFIAVYDVKLDSERTLISKTCSKNRLYHVLTSSWHNMQIEFRAGGGHGNGFFGKYELVDSTQAVFNITNDGMYLYNYIYIWSASHQHNNSKSTGCYRIGSNVTLFHDDIIIITVHIILLCLHLAVLSSEFTMTPWRF